jgi:hypothetical protein
MLKCEKCKRITPSKQPTGLLITTVRRLKGKDIVSQMRTCYRCSGEIEIKPKIEEK